MNIKLSQDLKDVGGQVLARKGDVLEVVEKHIAWYVVEIEGTPIAVSQSDVEEISYE